MNRKGLQRYVLLILVILVFTVCNTLAVEASIRVEPSRFIINLQPGERSTGMVTVTNNSWQSVDLVATVYDWYLDEQYQIVNMESGTLKETLEGCIRFNPTSFTLGPGESQIVRFTLTFPQDGEGSFERRGIIFFEHEEQMEGLEEGLGATIKTMIGTTIYLQPAQYRLFFRILEALMHITEEGEYWGAMLLANESVVHLRMQMEYRLIDARGRIQEEGILPERVLLPGEIRPLYFQLRQKPLPGSYDLHLIFHFEGSRDVVRYSIPFVAE